MRNISLRNLQLGLPTVIAAIALVVVSLLTYVITRARIRNDRWALVKGETLQLKQALAEQLDDLKGQIQNTANMWMQFAAVPQANESRRNQQTSPSRHFVMDYYLSSVDSNELSIFIVDDRTGVIESSNEPRTGSRATNISDILPKYLLATWRGNKEKTDKILVLTESIVLMFEPQSSGRRLTSQGERYMVLGTHIQRGQAEAESILAIVPWLRFQKVLNSAKAFFKVSGFESGYAFLFGSDGDTVLAHRRPAWIGLKLSADFDLPDLRDAVLKAGETNPIPAAYRLREPGSWKQSDGTRWKALLNSRYVRQNFTGIPKFVAMIRLDAPGFERTRWYLSAGLNNDDAFSLINDISLPFLLSPAIAIVFLVAFNQLLRRNMRLSVLTFAAMAREVADGKEQVAADSAVVDDMQDALRQILLLVKAKSGFVPISNPYIAGNPIKTPQMFFGRDTDSKWIGHQLSLPSNSMIGVYGPRRIGKTSLLQHINRPDFDSRLATIFIDTQEMLPAISDDSGFYGHLEEKIECETGTEDQNRPRGSAASVMSALERARTKVHPRRLVILIDELENLEYKFAAKTLSRDIPMFLASLLEGQAPLSFVVSGSDQQQLKSDNWSILSPKITSRRIGVLGLRDAVRLITEPLHENNVSIGKSLVDAILRHSGRHPYYTQLLCRMLVDELNQEHRYILEASHLERALSLVLDSPPAPLNYVWRSFTDPMLRLACAAFAFALHTPHESLSPEKMLLSLPAEARVLITDRVAFQVAIDQLEQDEWFEMEKRNQYRFRADLFRCWLKRYHSIWQTTAELTAERSK